MESAWRQYRRAAKQATQVQFLLACLALELFAAFLCRDLLRLVAPSVDWVPFTLYWVAIGAHLTFAALPGVSRPAAPRSAAPQRRLAPSASPPTAVGTLPEPFSALRTVAVAWEPLTGSPGSVFRYPIGRFTLPYPVAQVAEALLDKYAWRPGQAAAPAPGAPWRPPLREVRLEDRGELRNGASLARAFAVHYRVLLDGLIPSALRRLAVGADDEMRLRMDAELLLEEGASGGGACAAIVAHTRSLNLAHLFRFQVRRCQRSSLPPPAGSPPPAAPFFLPHRRSCRATRRTPPRPPLRLS